jgi:polyphenol oxidase
MLKKRINQVIYLTFPSLIKYESILWHGIFTRKEGFSKAPYNSLNISFAVKDITENVEKNVKILKKHSGADEFFHLNQIHGDRIVIIDKNTLDPFNEIELLPADAMITSIKNKFLLIKVADCQAIFLLDPIKKVIANIHSGWRSSLINIAGKTVHKMNKEFGCDPSNIIAAISPSLGPCCAEFQNYEKEFAEEFFKYKKEDFLFDFWQMTFDQLTDAGLSASNIELSKICTSCNTDLFFSYRKENITGRFGAVIGLI